MPESIVRFEHVSVHFGDVNALDDVSFEVFKGESKIILGAAGSGKSVLLKTALGLVRPDSGRVFLFDQDVTGIKEERMFEIRSRIGVLFQEGGLFDSLTVQENVEYPLLQQEMRSKDHSNGNRLERVKEVLSFVELGDTLDRFPSQLSGGMRRRVGIARAFVNQPPLILYDSPTAGLDPITANNIIRLIIVARDQQNTTTMIVTHRSQDGQLMANYRYDPKTKQVERKAPGDESQSRTSFLVFREGRLVFQGTEDELNASTDPYISKFKAVTSD